MHPKISWEESAKFSIPKNAFIGGWVSNLKDLTWNSERSEGEILKKMVCSSPKKSNCEVAWRKWWVFSDVGFKFSINVTKLSIVSPEGEAVIAPLAPYPLGALLIRTQVYLIGSQSKLNYLIWEILVSNELIKWFNKLDVGGHRVDERERCSRQMKNWIVQKWW